MIDTGTESFPMVAIFMPLVDAVCAEFEIDPPLRGDQHFKSRGEQSNGEEQGSN